MSLPDYEYHGLLASTWDLWRDDTANWSDRHFFLTLIERFGQPVLDLGCGTGRLVLDYAKLGIDIDGIDNSPEMLDICRAKAQKLGVAPALLERSLESLDLPRRYRTILGPSSVMQLCLTEGLASTLRRVIEYIEPGGAFVTPFGFAWREGDPLDTGWQLLFEKVRPEDGAIVRSWTHEWHEPAKQLWHAEQRFEVELGGKVIAREQHRRSPQGRWYRQQQVVRCFRDAGFADVQLFHEFDITVPAREGDRLFSVLGIKPLRPL
jgi:SAM-dependent methyltransferase